MVGAGTIAASWAALFLAHGLDVVATDVAPDAKAKLCAYVDQAWPELENLGLKPGTSRDRLRFSADLTAQRDATLQQLLAARAKK